MIVPVGGFGGPGGAIGPKRIGLDIAGENGVSKLSSSQSTNGPSFGDSLKRALNDVSTSQDVSQDYIQKFVRGEPVELHQVMAAAEEASISLEMLVELRNKMMDAYKTVMQMG